MEFLSRVLKGLVVGVANIIPGVSGGTMAVVMGIYDRLIGAVSDLRRDFKNSLLYLFPIGIGAVLVGVGVLLGIFFGAKGINWCMKHYEQQTYFAILGLIAGSVPPILLNAGFTPGVQTVVSLFTLAAGAAIAWWMGKLES